MVNLVVKYHHNKFTQRRDMEMNGLYYLMPCIAA